MLRLYRVCATALLILKLLTASLTIAGPLDPRRLRVDYLSIDEGLSQSTGFCLLRDSLGFLWIGTEDGLNKYDGYNFRIYRSTAGDKSPLSDNWISDILEGDDGQIWVVTRIGLDQLDRSTGSVVRHPIERKHPDFQAWTAVEDQEGVLWTTTSEGVFRLASAASTMERVDLPEAEYRSSTIDPEGKLWFGTWGDGVISYDPVERRHSQFVHPIAESRFVRAVLPWSDHTWLVGTSAGLHTFDLRTGEYGRFSNLLGHPSDAAVLDSVHVTTLDFDADRWLWVGTRDSGLIAISPRNSTVFRLSSDQASHVRLRNNTIWDLAHDPSGVLWAGTGTGGGLAKLTSRRFSNTTHDPDSPGSIAHDTVWSLLEDARGGFWVGTSGGLSYRPPGNQQFTRIGGEDDPSLQLPDQRIWALAESLHGEIWIGTYAGGIVRYRPETRTSTTIRAGSAASGTVGTDRVRAILVGRDESVWIGTDGGGLSRLDPRKETTVTYRKQPDVIRGPPDDRIWAILEAYDGTIWIGTDGGGLSRLNRNSGTFRHYAHNAGNLRTLGSDRIWSLHESETGAIWIGTKDGGLHRYLDGCDCFERYTAQKDHLPNNTIYGILEGEGGTLWISTNKGIANFDPDSRRVFSYDTRDGLATNEYSFGAATAGQDGLLHFGSIRGFTSFNPAAPNDSFAPRLAITDLEFPFSQGRQEVLNGDHIVIDQDDAYFTLRFSALDLRSPHSTGYRFRLTGIDDNWRQSNADNRMASYSLLPPGEYEFTVQGTSRDGRWSPHTRTVQLVVSARLWQTPSFRLSVASAAALGLFHLIGRRRKRQQKLERQLQKGREAERGMIATLIHDGPVQLARALQHQAEQIERTNACPSSSGALISDIRHGLVTLTGNLRQIGARVELLRNIDDVGMEIALYGHLATLEQRGFPVPKLSVDVEEECYQLLSDSDLAILHQVAQRAIDNVVQHAEAAEASVVLRESNGRVQLAIRDDGEGFDPRSVWQSPPGTHFGLASARSALLTIGGALEIQSTRGTGTTIIARLDRRKSQIHALYDWLARRFQFSRMRPRNRTR